MPGDVATQVGAATQSVQDVPAVDESLEIAAAEAEAKAQTAAVAGIGCFVEVRLVLELAGKLAVVDTDRSCVVAAQGLGRVAELFQDVGLVQLVEQRPDTRPNSGDVE